LGVTGSASRYKPNNLIMQLSGDDFQSTQQYQVIASDLRLALKTPYYVAAVVTNKPLDDQQSGGTVTFYALNLNDPKAEWQTVTQRHSMIGGYVNSEQSLIIGGSERSATNLWDGVISRVVVTNAALLQNQLSFGSVQLTPRCLFDAQAETLANTSEPRFIWETSAKLSTSKKLSTEQEALTDFCHALINSNEFLYLH
jgi:hypothetical protein